MKNDYKLWNQIIVNLFEKSEKFKLYGGFDF